MANKTSKQTKRSYPARWGWRRRRCSCVCPEWWPCRGRRRCAGTWHRWWEGCRCPAPWRCTRLWACCRHGSRRLWVWGCPWPHTPWPPCGGGVPWRSAARQWSWASGGAEGWNLQRKRRTIPYIWIMFSCGGPTHRHWLQNPFGVFCFCAVSVRQRHPTLTAHSAYSVSTLFHSPPTWVDRQCCLTALNVVSDVGRHAAVLPSISQLDVVDLKNSIRQNCDPTGT